MVSTSVLYTYVSYIIIVIIIVYIIYDLKNRGNMDLYYYTIVDLEKNAYKIEHSKMLGTHHITAPIYNYANEIVGNVFSQNTYNYFYNSKQVTTITTYKFNDGVLVCNFFYSTNDSKDNYVDGKIFSKPTFSSGKYFNKNVNIEVDGSSNTSEKHRLLKITY